MGLGYLHSIGIIYRDIKLENILIDELGHTRLADFGMAKILKPDEINFTFCGTPEYLSPEILKGDGYDKNTDWWSIGILTYELLYGISPFFDNN